MFGPEFGSTSNTYCFPRMFFTIFSDFFLNQKPVAIFQSGNRYAPPLCQDAPTCREFVSFVKKVFIYFWREHATPYKRLIK